jgi:hypothetical protein
MRFASCILHLASCILHLASCRGVHPAQRPGVHCARSSPPRCLHAVRAPRADRLRTLRCPRTRYMRSSRPTSSSALATPRCTAGAPACPPSLLPSSARRRCLSLRAGPEMLVLARWPGDACPFACGPRPHAGLTAPRAAEQRGAVAAARAAARGRAHARRRRGAARAHLSPRGACGEWFKRRGVGGDGLRRRTRRTRLGDTAVRCGASPRHKHSQQRAGCARRRRASRARVRGRVSDGVRGGREAAGDPPPPPPSRTDWTRLVPPPVLTGYVSSLLPYSGAGCRVGLAARGRRARDAPAPADGDRWRAGSPRALCAWALCASSSPPEGCRCSCV